MTANTIISLEGNIGSGKSTILQIMHQKYQNNPNVIFVDEPVSEWNLIKDGNKSILELFYEDQAKYSFVFQIMAYITRLRKLLQVLENNSNKIIICERSIYTDKYVFAKMLYQQGHINEIEWQTYNYWFDTFKEKTKLNMIIYVNTNPEICFERIKKRNRTGESNIPIDYLEHCHRLHNEWLDSNNEEVIIPFDGNLELKEDNKSTYFQSLESLLGIPM
jgi:deoxyguanosine kinase